MNEANIKWWWWFGDLLLQHGSRTSKICQPFVIVIVKCNNLGRVFLGFLSNIIHKIITVFYFKILTLCVLYVVDNTQKRQ